MLASLLSLSLAASLPPGLSGEAGAEGAFATRTGETVLARPYVSADYKQTFEDPGTLTPDRVEAAALVRKDFAHPGPEPTTPQVMGKALWARYGGEHWQTTLGLQEIAWGETFVVAVTDIVNPHDYREFLLEDYNLTRLPSWTLNQQFFLGAASLQILATPMPTRDAMPSSYFGYDIVPGPTTRPGVDGEYGARAGYLLGDVDLKAFYLRHWSRTPAFELVPDASGVPVAHEVEAPVDSYGASFSYAVGSLVFRGDGVYTKDQPYGFGVVRRADQADSIVGADYTWPGGLVLGLQYQIERLYDDDRITQQWVSFQAKDSVHHGDFDLLLFAFKGVTNGDFWVRPQVGWNATKKLAVLVSYDYIHAGQGGYLTPVEGDDQIYSSVSYKF